MNANPIQAKPHYLILDGLRGVAALMVVAFHLLEAHAPNRFEQIINHGYLAVDFFFMLSGFVIAYAYDDRWTSISSKDFFKRRLIRLQPMVVMGMLIGAILFYFQDYSGAPGISTTPPWKLILITLIGCTLLPVPLSMDIRGWHEMHPLNGPGWSLFFEYIANVLYALFIRRFSNKALSVLVLFSAGLLVHLALTKGDMIGGWSLTGTQLHIGFTRLLFPFTAGLLLSRVARHIRIKHAFLVCSLLIVTLLSMPRFGGKEFLWMNGLYEACCIIFVFPIIILIGAGAPSQGKISSRISRFLGEISYPLYITHYPLIYLYFALVRNNDLTLQKALPLAALLYIVAIAIAYASLKWYDEPVRKWLTKKSKKLKPVP